MVTEGLPYQLPAHSSPTVGPAWPAGWLRRLRGRWPAPGLCLGCLFPGTGVSELTGPGLTTSGELTGPGLTTAAPWMRARLFPPSSFSLLLPVGRGASRGLSPRQLGLCWPSDLESVALYLERLSFTAGSPFSRPGCSWGARWSHLPQSGPGRSQSQEPLRPPPPASGRGLLCRWVRELRLVQKSKYPGVWTDSARWQPRPTEDVLRLVSQLEANAALSCEAISVPKLSHRPAGQPLEAPSPAETCGAWTSFCLMWGQEEARLEPTETW